MSTTAVRERARRKALKGNEAGVGHQRFSAQLARRAGFGACPLAMTATTWAMGDFIDLPPCLLPSSPSCAACRGRKAVSSPTSAPSRGRSFTSPPSIRLRLHRNPAVYLPTCCIAIAVLSHLRKPWRPSTRLSSHFRVPAPSSVQNLVCFDDLLSPKHLNTPRLPSLLW